MKKNIKLMNVNVLSVMQRIGDAHIEHYRSDLDIDMSALRAVAGTEDGRGRTFLWLCRKSGSWLLNERNVLLRDSSENNTCRFYDEQDMGNEILAYIIEVSERRGRSVVGNIYSLDYAAYCEYIRQNAARTDVCMTYERGKRVIPVERMTTCPDAELGKLQAWVYQPKSSETVDALMAETKRERMKFTAVELDEFLRKAAVPADAKKKAG